MPITATCPSCSQMCQVEDQYAGQMVRCPKCGNVIQVAPSAAAVTAAPPPAVPVSPGVAPASAPPSPPAGPAGPGLMETLQQSIAAFGLDPLTVKLIYAGLGCFAAMIVFTIFPWVSISSTFGGLSASASVLGISLAMGWITILLTLGAGAFVAVVFLVLKKNNLLDISLWVAAGWALLASLWRLVNVAQAGGFSGIGLYLSLFASLGAAGTFGFVVFNRLTKKKA
jgi:hypothetical protein